MKFNIEIQIMKIILVLFLINLTFADVSYAIDDYEDDTHTVILSTTITTTNDALDTCDDWKIRDGDKMCPLFYIILVAAVILTILIVIVIVFVICKLSKSTRGGNAKEQKRLTDLKI